MARMFPEHGPAPGTTSKAEKRIYALLADALDNAFAVFHGVKWETREADNTLARRESDFLIIHPAHGALIVEAKGGHLRRSEASGGWWTKQGSRRRPTRDPFEQAMSLAPLLARHLWTAPLTRPFAPLYRIGYSVWFPDVEWKRGLSGDDALVLDRVDLDTPGAAILRAYAYFQQTAPAPLLGTEAVEALIAVLAPTVKVQSRLAVQIVGEERRIQELTDEQFLVLQALARHRRLAVSGAAGTGKTVLAYEKARRLAAQGLDTLLLCSNPALASWLRAKASREPEELRPRLTICDIDALCGWVAGAPVARLEIESDADDGVDNPDGKLPQHGVALARGVRALEKRGDPMPFDAILVDEAQDLDRAVWAPLTRLLRDRANGLLYIFYDEAQRDAPGGWRAPLPGDRTLMPLVVNLRNTQAIFDYMARFYRGPDAPVCRGPAGRAPVFLDPAILPKAEGDEQEAVALRLALDHLVAAEGVAPEDILLITCRSQKRSRWYTAERRTIGEHQLVRRPEGGQPGKVALSTIRSAKGLERKVVILSELDGLNGAGKRETLLYLALSRAVHHLIVLGPERALQPRKAKPLAGLRGKR